MRKHTIRFLVILLSVVFMQQVFQADSEACNVAVVSASASATGRPFIWKNRDHASSYRHEILYCEEVTSGVGGSLRLMGETLINTDVAVCTGGVNESGFAIANTTCIDSDNDPYDLYNVNTDLMVKALEDCKTLAQFEALAARFTSIWNNKNISGIFAVIDAYGGAAIYEMWTDGNGEPIMYRKYNANTGEITDEDGNPFTDIRFPQTDGFVNRTNSNHADGWIQIWTDTPRELRARQLITAMQSNDTLTPRNMMRLVSKDVLGGDTADYCSASGLDSSWMSNGYKNSSGDTWDELLQDNWDWSVDSWDDPNYDGELYTRYAISRYQTSMGLVIEGATSPEQAKLTTMWVSLGEPSLSVFIPYFPFAQTVSKYASDDEHSNSGYFWNGESDTENNEDNCFLNLLFDCVQCNPFSSSNYPELNTIFKNVSLYDNNGSGVGSGSYDQQSQRYTGTWLQLLYDYMDNTINYPRLKTLQKWTYPLENTVFDNTDDFISILENNPSLVTSELLEEYSEYCNRFVYVNYSNLSSTYLGWTHELPDNGVAPQVLSIIPADGAVDFPVTGSITVQFSEPIDETTVNTDSFQVLKGTALVSGTVTYDDDEWSATFTPSGYLDYDSTYTIRLTTEITDMSGKEFDGDTYTFDTVSIYNDDVNPPTITDTSTGDNGDDYPVNGTITVQFSEAMDESTIDESTFIVYAGDTRVDGTVTYNSSTHTATFTPSGSLDYDTTYTVTLTSDITDSSGDPISEYSWSFTTASTGSSNDGNDGGDDDPDDATNPVMKSYSGNSGGGCGFSAEASVGTGSPSDILPGFISLLTTMFFPLSLIWVHRTRRRRRESMLEG